jgi:hypothetical protein
MHAAASLVGVGFEQVQVDKVIRIAKEAGLAIVASLDDMERYVRYDRAG